MKVDHNDRGFELIDFKDLYRTPCSLQQSSLALDDENGYLRSPGESAVWLGVNQCCKCGNYTKMRMHLSRDGVRELILHLQKWLSEGSFELEDNSNKV